MPEWVDGILEGDLVAALLPDEIAVVRSVGKGVDSAKSIKYSKNVLTISVNNEHLTRAHSPLEISPTWNMLTFIYKVNFAKQNKFMSYKIKSYEFHSYESNVLEQSYMPFTT